MPKSLLLTSRLIPRPQAKYLPPLPFNHQMPYGMTIRYPTTSTGYRLPGDSQNVTKSIAPGLLEELNEDRYSMISEFI